MIYWKYYVVYVEVPSGHPGVECYHFEEPTDIPKFIKTLWTNKSYAVIGITRGV